jgi:hypothetical protein
MVTCRHSKIFVTLLLASTIGQIQGYAQTYKQEASAKSDAQVATPQHVIIDKINTQTSEQEAAKKQEKENREERHKDVELALTFAIALAAGVQAVFAFLQWLIYRNQLKTSMPLVIIDWDNFVHISPPDPDRSALSPMSHHFNWGIRNVGPTPAFISQTSARFVIVPTCQGIPKMEYASPEPYVGEPLLTEPKPVEGGMNFYAALEDRRAYEEIEDAYRSGNETLYAFGYVRFVDRYGMKHVSRFCLRYYAWKSMRRVYDGFGIAGIEQNRYS